jgi:DEAD/DEAH box helicase domain-containing protein
VFVEPGSIYSELGVLLGVQSSACKEGNLVCSKIGAFLVFQTILGFEIDLTSIPVHGDISADTIVEASPVRAIDRIKVEVDIQ